MEWYQVRSRSKICKERVGHEIDSCLKDVPAFRSVRGSRHSGETPSTFAIASVDKSAAKTIPLSC
jgi:hypothetical protein